MDPACYPVPVEQYIGQLQAHVLQKTGYAVEFAQKPQLSFIEMVQSLSGAPSISENVDPVLLQEGNCIPSAFYFALGKPFFILGELKRNLKSNREAIENGYRSYRDCQKQ